MENYYKAIIIGSGPAGLTAAIYLARADIIPLVVDGSQPGGQLTTTTEVGNYPGFPEEVSGPDLMNRMRKQAEYYGTKFLSGEVKSVNFKNKPFEIIVGQETLTADAVIVATGSSAMWLNLESEQKLRGKGVSACATCDGFFFKNKDVVVVGGGDTAMEEATFLTKLVKSVTLVHRRDEFRASKIMQTRLKNDKKIKLEMNSDIVEVIGDQSVTGVKIKNKESGKEKVINAQGLFIAIGHKPNTEFLKDQIELKKKYIKVTDNTKTSVKGVFTAGDVNDYRYRQAVTAAGMGCMAALDAQHYLEDQGKLG